MIDPNTVLMFIALGERIASALKASGGVTGEQIEQAKAAGQLSDESFDAYVDRLRRKRSGGVQS